MELLLKIALALLPVVLLLLYIWKKDQQPEPTSWLMKALVWGGIICIPVAIVEVILSDVIIGGENPTTILQCVEDAFLCAALPEEGFKLIALWIILRKNPYFDEHFDGIVYAVFIGLGFAALENVGYVISAEESWKEVVFMRAFLSVPGHYAYAIFMGYYYSVYHFVNKSPMTAVRILLVPVIGAA